MKFLAALLLSMSLSCHAAERNIAEPNGPIQHMVQLQDRLYIFESEHGTCDKGLGFGYTLDDEGNKESFCYHLDVENGVVVVTLHNDVKIAIPAKLTHTVTGAGHT